MFFSKTVRAERITCVLCRFILKTFPFSLFVPHLPKTWWQWLQEKPWSSAWGEGLGGTWISPPFWFLFWVFSWSMHAVKCILEHFPERQLSWWCVVYLAGFSACKFCVVRMAVASDTPQSVIHKCQLNQTLPSSSWSCFHNHMACAALRRFCCTIQLLTGFVFKWLQAVGTTQEEPNDVIFIASQVCSFQADSRSPSYADGVWRDVWNLGVRVVVHVSEAVGTHRNTITDNVQSNSFAAHVMSIRKIQVTQIIHRPGIFPCGNWQYPIGSGVWFLLLLSSQQWWLADCVFDLSQSTQFGRIKSLQ